MEVSFQGFPLLLPNPQYEFVSVLILISISTTSQSLTHLPCPFSF